MSDYYMPRDGAQGIKRESTWRPKAQPSRPPNAWADAPGPSRKGEYYEPPKRDSWEDRRKDRERDEDREERGRSRSRSRERDQRDGGRDFRDRDRDRDRDRKWRKDDNRSWDDYRRRRRSPERWRDRDDRGDRWRADDRRDRDRSRSREEPLRRWGRSPDPERRSPSPPPRARNRSPPFRRSGARDSPDYAVGRRYSDSEDDRSRSPSPRRTPRRRSPSPRGRSPSPVKRRISSPALPDPKRTRGSPRGRSPSPQRTRPRDRDRSASRSRSPARNGRGGERDFRRRSPSPPSNFGRGRWARDRWQPQQLQQPRTRDGEPVKMRVWGRPSSKSPARKPSSRSRSRSRSPIDDALRPVRPRADAQIKPRDALPYDATPERDTPTNGGSAHARAAMREWKSAPTGPAAQRNGTHDATIITEALPQDDFHEINEPTRASDRWSPIKRSSPVRPELSLAPTSDSETAHRPPIQQTSSASRPASIASRPAFVPRVPPSGPASVTGRQPSAPSGPASVASAAASVSPAPPSGPSTPRPESYLQRITDKQQQYDKHLSTIAPYISTAFGQWYAQNATPPLHEFLVHHFGRQPSKIEMDQIHQLLRMRSQLSKDQQELKSMHAQALRSEIAPPPDAPSGPRATREREEVRFGAPPAGPAPPLGIPPFPLPPSAPRQPPKPRPKPVVAPKQPRRRAVAGERYERLAQVGEGTYGKVYKARNTGSGALVALKRIRMEQEREGFPVTSMREIKLLQALDHPNIVRLMEMMVSHNSVYMVLEYMNHDLTGILSHPEVKLSPANIKSLNYQMLSGLGYLHRRGILHRDMKGSNILLNGEGELKLADFGLARWYHKHKRDDYTNRVITLWYRSPELLMGETAYGPEVDTWSAGCIMLEIFTGKPTFQGQDEISQLDAIWAILGTPLEADWPAVTDLPWYELVRPREAITSRFAEKFSLSAGAMEVVKGLLELNPAKRLLADDALDKAYFVSEAPQMEQPTQLATCGEHHEMTVKMQRRREK